MGSPDSLRIFLAASTLVPLKYISHQDTGMDVQWKFLLPSSRTMSGTFSCIVLEALTIPEAIVAQLTIPPKTLTRMAFTFLSGKRHCKFKFPIP